MTRLYCNEASDPKLNAQRNLYGRTHYVDDDTLRFHKSRVLSSRHTREGMLFAIVTSDSLNFEGTRRGFRYVIFDLFGRVIERTEIDNAFRTSQQALAAMWKAVDAIDAKAVTLAAIDKRAADVAAELAALRSKIEKKEG